MNEDGIKELRYSWFPFVTAPIALLYLGFAVLDRVVDRIESAPDWLALISLLSVFVLLPIVAQVNQYNQNQPDILKLNGRFTWRTWLLIILYAPLAIMVLFASVIIFSELVKNWML